MTRVSNQRYRFQFDINSRQKAQIEKIQKALDANSKIEVIRRALTFLERGVDGEVYKKNQDGTFSPIVII